jgi:hypothetical protein
MIDDGAQNIVITGLADVGLIPKYDRDNSGTLDATEQTRSDRATEYSLYLDQLIRTQVVPALRAQLAAQNVDPNKIVYVPIMDHVSASGQTVTGALNANLPTLALLHNVTPPAGFAGTPAQYLASQLDSHSLQYRGLVFFDGVHPNAQSHALLASYMQALITKTPWVETMPYLGDDVDYRTTASISAAGEVDSASVYMVAGTNYTFQMLGISTVTSFVLGQLDLAALGGAVLADPSLRLLSSGGTVLQADDDSGAGLDSMLSFNATTAGIHTLQLSAVGSLTGTPTPSATRRPWSSRARAALASTPSGRASATHSPRAARSRCCGPATTRARPRSTSPATTSTRRSSAIPQPTSSRARAAPIS